MMEVYKGKSRYIDTVERKEDSLFLIQAAGTIRISPQTDTIIRISYSENNIFSQNQGKEFQKFQNEDWKYEILEEEIRIDTKRITLKIARDSGAIRYETTSGTLLLQEHAQMSKQVEAFDTYSIVVNENTQTVDIDTPDGKKRKVLASDRVKTGSLYHTKLSLSFQEDEALYGLGQAEEGVFNLRHTTQYLHQANLKIAIPMLISSKGYGLLLSTQSPVIFEDTQYGSYLYTEADEFMDYYFLAAEEIDEIVKGYRKITGKAAMLPKWAFGYIQSQERYETAEEIVETAKEFRNRKIGLDAIVLDWMSWKGNLWGQKTFDEERFPNPKKMVEELHNQKVHFMISIWPNMNEESADYKEFAAQKLLMGASNIYNAFLEEGRDLYWKQLERNLFSSGVDAWWCDSSEPITPEWERKNKPNPGESYCNYVKEAEKIMPLDRANAYGLYHAQGIYEGQRRAEDGRRIVNLTRNGYVGSQKYGTILWSGDIGASWQTLKKQIVAGLQFCTSGLPYWTLDIGAFFVKKGAHWFWNGEYDSALEDLGYKELYVRWYQYGAFLPIFRGHGTDCRREPWHFGKVGERFYDAIIEANRMRYHFMPYIYSAAGMVWKEDETIMRPLIYDYVLDTLTFDIKDQFLFGPSLMICPVTEPMYYESSNRSLKEKSKTRRVYLPSGNEWYDIRTDEKYLGGQEIEVSADIENIPVFVKAGGILPTLEVGENATDKEGADIQIEVFRGRDASYSFYEDAGDGYGYEKGDYCITTFCYVDKTEELTWETNGNLQYRKGKFVIKMH